MSPIHGTPGQSAWHNWAGPMVFAPVPGAAQAPFGPEDLLAPLHELLLTHADSIQHGMDQEAHPARLIQWSNALQTRIAELSGDVQAHDARCQDDPTAGLAVANRRFLEAQIAQLQSLVDWIGTVVDDRNPEVDAQPDVAAARHLWAFRQQQTAIAVTYLEYTQAAAGRNMGADHQAGPHTPGLEAGRADDAYYNMMFALMRFERGACIRVLDSAEASFLAQWRLYGAMDSNARRAFAVPVTATGVELMHLVRVAGDVATCYPNLPDFSASASLASRNGDVNLPPMDAETRDLNEEVRAANLRAHFVRHAGANGSLNNAVDLAASRLMDHAAESKTEISNACTHALGLTMQAHVAIRDALVGFRSAVGELLWNTAGEDSPLALDLASRAAERSPSGEPTVRKLPETADYTILIGFESSNERISQASDDMMKARAALSTAIRAMGTVPELSALRDVAQQVMDRMFSMSQDDRPSEVHAALSQFVDMAANYGPLVRQSVPGGWMEDAHWIEVATTQILSPEADQMYFATHGPGARPLMD